MKKPDLNPLPFDDEERDLMEAFDKAFADGSLVSHLTPARQAELQAAAKATMNPPKKQISTRLAERDLVRLKAKALELGVPYQSLLASIVHRYVEGALVERE
jgi:predicted DNA binding CopG/RHH family protein